MSPWGRVILANCVITPDGRMGFTFWHLADWELDWLYKIRDMSR